MRDALKWATTSFSRWAAIKGSREATMSLTTARPSSDFPEAVMEPKSVRTAFVDLIPPAFVWVWRYRRPADVTYRWPRTSHLCSRVVQGVPQGSLDRAAGSSPSWWRSHRPGQPQRNLLRPIRPSRPPPWYCMIFQ
jgi:hypothetical protein